MIVLVTGASKGIGKAIAERFAAENHTVITVARSKALLDQAASRYPNMVVFQADLTNKQDILKLYSFVDKKFGQLDVLVNNAGIAMGGLIEDFPEESLDYIFDLNVKAPYLLVKYFTPIFKKQKKGHIINISSGSGKAGNATQTAYCASKFALNGLSESLKMELKPFNIKITSICPGMVATKKYGKEFKTENMLQVHDIADFAYFVTSVNFSIPEAWIVPFYPIYMIKESD